MHTYEIAVGACLVVLFFALILIVETMRRGVHEARYGYQQIGPWDVRYVNDFLFGIWNSHKRLYPRSRVRLCFAALLIAFVICFAAGLCIYLYARK